MKRCPTSQLNAASAQSGLRAGLTLFEVLIVMGILIFAASITVPVVQDAYAVRLLEEGGEQVRQAISQGRGFAIRSGLVYEFRFEPGKSRFIMLPNPADVPETTEDNKYFGLWGDLGEGFEFREELDSAGTGEQLSPEWFESIEGGSELSGGSWSDPVEFSFEGNARDAFVYMLDSQKRSVRIDIRGLTGAVNVSRVSWEAVGQ